LLVYRVRKQLVEEGSLRFWAASSAPGRRYRAFSTVKRRPSWSRSP